MPVFKNLCFSLGLVLLLVIFPDALAAKLPRGMVEVNQHQFQVEVALTADSQSQGLSGKIHLPKDAGMYFIFPSAENRNFWMKEMNFPLDIIWIRQGAIVGIAANIPKPESKTATLELIPSKVPADAVLEINAGLADLYGFKVGDKLRFVGSK